VLFDGVALRDSLTAATYPLNDFARRLAHVLHTPLTFDELLEVAGPAAVPPAKVERELRQMLVCGLLEGSCDTIRTRLERIRAGEPLAPLVLEGSRFACHNSGACCRGYMFGPIREEEKARIEGLDPRKALPHLGAQPLFVESGLTSGRPTYNLATVGDTCVFLEGGSHCGLHRAFGAEAKPALCQLYPLAAVATIDGLKVYDRGECASFAVSAQTGVRLEDAVPAIRGLIHEEVYHPMVWVHGLWRCDYGLVLMLSRRLDGEACRTNPAQALHNIGHIVRGFVAALVQCPLEPGQPESLVAEMLGLPAREFRPPEDSVAANAVRGLRALFVLAEALQERVALNEYLTPPFLQSASLLREICHNLLNGEPLSDRALAATSIGVDLHTARALALSIRHQLFGRDLLLDDHLPAGLLRIALVYLLTLAGAGLRALDENQGRIGPGHVSASHMVVKRTLRRHEPNALLAANGEQAWPILDALPLLSRMLGCEANGSPGAEPFHVLAPPAPATP
jgi:hypothetical protein